MTYAGANFAHHEAIVYNEIRKPLAKLRDECGGRLRTARILGWKLSDVNKVLDTPPLTQFAASPVLELTIDDLKKCSLVEIRQIVRCAVVKSLKRLGATLYPADRAEGDEGKRVIARFLRVDDSFVRRAMDHPVLRRHVSFCRFRQLFRDRQRKDLPPAPEETSRQFGKGSNDILLNENCSCFFR